MGTLPRVSAERVTCRSVDGHRGYEGRHRLLREVYDAANRGDFDALLERLHTDIVWVTPTRRITGRNQVAGWLIGWHASAAPTHRPEEFIDVDDTTIALVSISYTDARPDNHPAHVWRFRDGLVVRLEVFPQREDALAVHGPDAGR
jgi:ketosteroid isomerase-like protein